MELSLAPVARGSLRAVCKQVTLAFGEVSFLLSAGVADLLWLLGVPVPTPVLALGAASCWLDGERAVLGTP